MLEIKLSNQYIKLPKLYKILEREVYSEFPIKNCTNFTQTYN